MIIHKSVITKKNNFIRVSAEIETNSLSIGKTTLWFEVENNDNIKISDRADAFVASLFLLAMRLNEDIEVKGEFSPKLLEGINKYQKIYHSWFPKEYTIIKINCNKLKPSLKEGNGIACAFTGGVDSFYTLWSNILQNQPNKNKQISHLLFVQGADSDCYDLNTYYKTQETFKNVADSLGLTLLTVRTNIRKIADLTISWVWLHGAGLTGAALIFEPLFSNFYIGSSYAYSNIQPCGSHPETDPFLSSESLQIIHHGADKIRLKKTIAISKWDKTFKVLRVCNLSDTDKNCCRCNKCIRTMLTLQLAGTLHRYTSFDLPLVRKEIRNKYFVYKADRMLIEEIIDYAQKIGRSDVVFDLKWALLKSSLPALIIQKLEKYKVATRLLNSKFGKTIFFKKLLSKMLKKI